MFGIGGSVAHSSLEQTRIPVKWGEPEIGNRAFNHGDGASTSASWDYPAPPSTGGVTEIIHGVQVKDPWRALEDFESEAAQRFISQQNALSMPFLNDHSLRGELEAAVQHNYTYERTSCPMLQGDGYHYWTYNDGATARDVFVRSTNLKRDFGRPPTVDRMGPELVFDPNGEEHMSLYAYSWSPNGRYWCAVLQESGSDWQRLRTYDTRTRQSVDDDLYQSKFTFGATWIGNKGFLYKKAIDEEQGSSLSLADGQFGIYYHRIGSPQSADSLVWYGTGQLASNLMIGRPRLCSADESLDSGRRAWVMFDIYRNTNPESETLMFEIPAALFPDHEALVAKLDSLLLEESKWISTGYTGETKYIGTLSSDRHIFTSNADGVVEGRVLYFDSADWDATTPQGKLPLRELVPRERNGLYLQSAHLVGDRMLVLIYLRDACAAVVFVDAITGMPIGSADANATRGTAQASLQSEIPVPPQELNEANDETHAVVIPKHATVSTVSSKQDSDIFYMTVETFVAPPYVLSGRLVGSSGKLGVVLDRLETCNPPPAEDLICEQVFYPSHDGVQIPMFVVYAKKLDRSCPSPTLLHAYGGFAVPLTPHFDPLFSTFIRSMQGIVAIPGIRGGGEYGKAWHEAALGVNRWVAFEDFACAGKYIHAEGLSIPSLTAVYGLSNGGLLVSATTNRHPGLFGAAIMDVGITDLVRFHKFTLGRLWMSEYGSPDDPAALPVIHKLSPLHNVDPKPSRLYPAILVTTADHDNRVIPAHSLKYLAELQHRKPLNQNVFLGRIYSNAGHEAGSKTTQQKVEEVVDRLIFMVSTLSSADGG